MCVCEPGSSFGIATGYGLDGPGIESRWGTRFSAPVQTDPGAHPASCTMGTGSFPGVKSGRGVTLTPHPLLVLWSRKSRAIPLPPPSYGPYGLYRASVPVEGCTFTLCVCVCVCGICSNFGIQNATVSVLKGGSTLVTLPRNVTPYRDSVNGARDRVTNQRLVTRSRYGLVRCAVGIWLSHQRDDTVKAGASVDVQRDAARPHLLHPHRDSIPGPSSP